MTEQLRVAVVGRDPGRAAVRAAAYATTPFTDLIETQCHGFDLLEHLVGPVASVTAQMTDVTYGDWSTVALALGFENGTDGRLVIHATVRELTVERAGDATASVWRAGLLRRRGPGLPRHLRPPRRRRAHGTPSRRAAARARRCRPQGTAARARPIESFETGQRVDALP